MMITILRFFTGLWGCRHKESFPITVGGRTYRVCVKCGREREYEWSKLGLVEVRDGADRDSNRAT